MLVAQVVIDHLSRVGLSFDNVTGDWTPCVAWRCLTVTAWAAKSLAGCGAQGLGGVGPALALAPSGCGYPALG